MNIAQDILDLSAKVLKDAQKLNKQADSIVDYNERLAARIRVKKHYAICNKLGAIVDAINTNKL